VHPIEHAHTQNTPVVSVMLVSEVAEPATSPWPLSCAATRTSLTGNAVLAFKVFPRIVAVLEPGATLSGGWTGRIACGAACGIIKTGIKNENQNQKIINVAKIITLRSPTHTGETVKCSFSGKVSIVDY